MKKLNPAIFTTIFAVIILTCLHVSTPSSQGDEIPRVETLKAHLILSPGEENPRNSEGDFVQLNNGNVLFVYTHFTGGAGDHATAHLAARVSEDQGQTWSEQDRDIVTEEGGMNVMSVSLLRLTNDTIALFYLRKNSLDDCQPYMRLSQDEGKTWSDAHSIIPAVDAGYYVLNNDRVVKLQSGRIIVPLALHKGPDAPEWDPKAHMLCYYSDDNGTTWQRSQSVLKSSALENTQLVMQEPGVVEVEPDHLLMFIRTNGGTQFFSRSTDGGDTWTKPQPSPLPSPLSPASIEMIPNTTTLAAVWNDHTNIPEELQGKRTPLMVALSTDGGKTWGDKQLIETDPNGWYCYTAMEFINDRLFLGYCAGLTRANGLNTTKIVSIETNELLNSK